MDETPAPWHAVGRSEHRPPRGFGYRRRMLMKVRRIAIGCGALILAVAIIMFAASKILPGAVEKSFPAIRESTRAFDVSQAADGDYEGASFVAPVSVKVKVVVKGGRMASVELLKHFNGQGKPAEAIVQKALEAQSLGVDVITGATYSSLAILKAIEDALSKGIRR